MLFINPQNEYPRHIGDLQLEHPGWQVGDPIPEGWKEVAYATSRPEVSENETIEEELPTIIDGILTQTFSIRSMTDEEIAFHNAPVTAKEKLIKLGLTEEEIRAFQLGLIY